MKNWLEQEIEVGSLVYRGARQGNTTEYKVGKVLELNEEKQKVRVFWFLQPTYEWQRKQGQKSWRNMLYPQSKGWASVDTMVLIDAPILKHLTVDIPE